MDSHVLAERGTPAVTAVLTELWVLKTPKQRTVYLSGIPGQSYTGESGCVASGKRFWYHAFRYRLALDGISVSLVVNLGTRFN